MGPEWICTFSHKQLVFKPHPAAPHSLTEHLSFLNNSLTWHPVGYMLISFTEYYLSHKAIIELIWGFIKARCCWIWRLSIYGVVLSKMSATCTSKSCFRNTYLTLTALINPASTVAVKAKRLCGATGEEPTERTNAQWRHTIEKEVVNDAQMCCLFSRTDKTTCCCLSMYWKQEFI